MGHETCKTLHLYGDKLKKAEPATHLIKFPGGSVELTRTSDGDYWVHVWVNRGEVIPDVPIYSRRGKIVSSRLDYEYQFGKGIKEIEDLNGIEHLAVRVSTLGGEA